MQTKHIVTTDRKAYKFSHFYFNQMLQKENPIMRSKYLIGRTIQYSVKKKLYLNVKTIYIVNYIFGKFT